MTAGSARKNTKALVDSVRRRTSKKLLSHPPYCMAFDSNPPSPLYERGDKRQDLNSSLIKGRLGGFESPTLRESPISLLNGKGRLYDFSDDIFPRFDPSPFGRSRIFQLEKKIDTQFGFQ